MSLADGASRDDTLSDDAFLGGRVHVLQPRRGHRSGFEAVLIAAACPLRPDETCLDLGAGAGAAAICALARVPGSRAILVEADPALAALARRNLERNGMSARAEVHELRIGTDSPRGLSAVADHAIANPPFREPGRDRSPPERAAAHLLAAEDLVSWTRFAAGAVHGSGTLTLVHRPAALEAVLAACGGRFGDLAVLPLHPRPGRVARRILVQGRRGSRAPVSLMPGRAMHGADGHGFAPWLEGVLRAAAPLAVAMDTRDRRGVGEGDEAR